MDLITNSNLRAAWGSAFNVSVGSRSYRYGVFRRISGYGPSSSFPFGPWRFRYTPERSNICWAKKENSEPEPILKPSIVDELLEDYSYDEGLSLDDLEDEELGDDGDDFLEDELEAEPVVGDGAGGGGVSLASTSWDKTALAIAEEVAQSFDGELGIYAFKTQLNGSIQVRIERLTNESGSPSLMDVEAFSSVYRKRLDEAEAAGSIPDNLSVEVSSPGVERVLRIPEDLDRFKDRPMFVKYITKVPETGSESQQDGIFRLVSFDLETDRCIWGIADVRINREKAGKGRPLSKKQREWRLETTFDLLRLVRLYSEM